MRSIITLSRYTTMVFGLATTLFVLTACGDSGGVGLSEGSGSGSGGANSTNGSGGGLGLPAANGSGNGSGAGSGAGGNNGCGSVLTGIIRDFQASHPDFEGTLGDDKGIVEQNLGADGKPVYAGNPTTLTTNGKDAFDQWFRDVPGVNMSIPTSITLTPMGNVSTYDNSAYFPIDDQGFGNEGNSHNYHFTLELRTQFEYKGGEVFTFTGDDDLFTFINGRLGIDLGGVHGAQSQTIDLDAMAGQLGITPGNTYPLDFFFAERHTSESNFRIETTIACFTPVPPPQ
jgi:fibro-slime domain-containing protein